MALESRVMDYPGSRRARPDVATGHVAEWTDDSEVHAVLGYGLAATAAEQARLALDLVGPAIFVGLLASHFFVPFAVDVAGIGACRHAQRQPHVSPQKRLSP